MKIGIVGWNVGENSFGATKAYMEFLSNFGEVLILPPSHESFDIDLLVLPGGKDMMSSKYGQVPSFLNSDPDVMKEFFYENNLKDYVERQVPIFGICLGAQMLNVFFNGHLQQSCDHPVSDERNEKVHPITFKPEFKNLVKNNKEYKVNSMHHQGIPMEGLGEGLVAIATHTENNEEIVEYFKHKTLPIWAVQWHPEEIYDPVTTNLLHTISKEKTV